MSKSRTANKVFKRKKESRRLRHLLNHVGDLFVGKLPNMARFFYGDGPTKNCFRVKD